MVQSLPGFLDLCLNVCSPSQVLGDVYTEVMEEFGNAGVIWTVHTLGRQVSIQVSRESSGGKIQ